MTSQIDLFFLDIQTSGDKDLQRELLVLFVEQATAIAACLDGSGDMAADLHLLKGSAGAIGAAGLAAEAADLERRLRERPAALPSTDLDGLRNSVAEVCSFAATIIAGA